MERKKTTTNHLYSYGFFFVLVNYDVIKILNLSETNSLFNLLNFLASQMPM